MLRIEDTDRPRTREEWIVGIQDTLGWLGLDWDEAPFLQSDRLDQYLAAADALLASGHAYECYCTPEEVKAMHAERRRPGARRATTAVAATSTPSRARARGRGPAALGAVPHARTRVAARSPTSCGARSSVEWSTISDFVIVRSDGSPVFFLANAVDDAEMGITHVIRGEDLLDTTHRVLALRAGARARATCRCTRTSR